MNSRLPDPRLSLIYRLEASVGEPQDVGEISAGHRRIVPLTGGTFSGPELRGTLLPGATADWHSILPDGTALGDVPLHAGDRTWRSALRSIRCAARKHGRSSSGSDAGKMSTQVITPSGRSERPGATLFRPRFAISAGTTSPSGPDPRRKSAEISRVRCCVRNLDPAGLVILRLGVRRGLLARLGLGAHRGRGGGDSWSRTACSTGAAFPVCC